MTLFLFRTILIVHEKESYAPKFKVYVFRTYTATYSTVSCHSCPIFAYQVITDLNKQPKNVLYLQKKSSTRQFESKLSLRSFAFSLKKKSCISAKYLSKLNILHSICIFFAPSTNESAQGASQEASITTKGGHNRRQPPVIY